MKLKDIQHFKFFKLFPNDLAIYWKDENGHVCYIDNNQVTRTYYNDNIDVYPNIQAELKEKRLTAGQIPVYDPFCFEGDPTICWVTNHAEGSTKYWYVGYCGQLIHESCSDFLQVRKVNNVKVIEG